MISLAFLASLALIPHQFPVLGRGIPMASSGITASDITAADIDSANYYRVPLTDDNGNTIHYQFPGFGGKQGFAVYKVAGVNHFFIATSDEGAGATEVGAPVEMTEPGVYNASGVCTSGTCPSATYSTANRIPTANVIADWGLNGDNTVHDIYGGNLQNLWDLSAGTLTATCLTSGACEVGFATITPSGDWLISYNPNYGSGGMNYVEPNGSTLSTGTVSGAWLVHFVNPHTGGGVARQTSVTGPYVFKDASATTPPIATYPDLSGSGSTARYVGSFAAQYWVHMPDGSMGFGASDSQQMQQGGAPNGVSLQVAPAASWPTPSTPATSSARIVATQNWLHTYNLNGYYPSTGGALTTANWSFIPPGSYPYVYEGNGSGCNNGACLEIDPAANGGQGSWTETSGNGGMVCIQTATKQGCIAFLKTATNHAVNGTDTSCTTTYGGMRVAHNWYQTGGSPSPVYGCTPGASNQGPTSTAFEDRWEFYKWSDLQAVKGGTKTDYTVQPIDTLFSAVTYSLPTNGPNSHIPAGFTGSGVTSVAGGYDTDTNLLYVLFIDLADTGTTPVIGVFHIKQ